MMVIEGGDEQGVMKMIKGEIIGSEGEELGGEGCVSMGGINGEVGGFESVRVKGVDGEGKELIIR
ncbi:peptide deformylase, partial [Paenibacillus xylanexedens]|uniref:peptide deformylase n=1 Tax=Paenibacillus xylanexedens TaxID=528191 RepID=UPI0034D95D0B